MELERKLVRQLQKRGVKIEAPDGDTLLFRNVPLSAQSSFNKQRTNLLCKKTAAGVAYLVFVDEDLAYRGNDRELHRAFTGPTQNGWRALVLGDVLQSEPEVAVTNGLAALGFPDKNPQLRIDRATLAKDDGVGEQKGVLDAFSHNLTAAVIADSKRDPTVGREAETEAVSSCLLRWGQARLPLVVGASGVGKTNLLYSVARLLHQTRPKIAILRVNCAELLSGTLFPADRAKMLTFLLKDVRKTEDVVLALERIECVVREVPHGQLLLSDALDHGTRIVGTVFPHHVSGFTADPLARRTQVVVMQSMTARGTEDVLNRLRCQIGAHHRIKINDVDIRLCMKLARQLPGHLPAKAITLLDESASNAALLGGKALSPDDLHAACQRLLQGTGEEVS